MAILIGILLILLIDSFTLFSIEKKLSKVNFKPEPKKEEAKVTDPFTKPAPIYSSTNHIIVPKTPTEIRNQNYKKIKEGMEYGDIAER
jgi:hypothetical protein